MRLTIKPHRLPEQGIIRGSRAGRKMIIPRGTLTYAIRYERLYFTYLYETRIAALAVAEKLDADENFYNMLAWNFRSTPPIAIHRTKKEKVQ